MSIKKNAKDKIIRMICKLDGIVSATKVIRKQKKQLKQHEEKNIKDLDEINQEFQDLYREETEKEEESD